MDERRISHFSEAENDDETDQIKKDEKAPQGKKLTRGERISKKIDKVIFFAILQFFMNKTVP